MKERELGKRQDSIFKAKPTSLGICGDTIEKGYSIIKRGTALELCPRARETHAC